MTDEYKVDPALPILFGFDFNVEWYSVVVERNPSKKVNHRVGDFYNKDFYRTAVLRAIAKNNRCDRTRRAVRTERPCRFLPCVHHRIGNDAETRKGRLAYARTVFIIARLCRRIKRLKPISASVSCR